MKLLKFYKLYREARALGLSRRDFALLTILMLTGFRPVGGGVRRW